MWREGWKIENSQVRVIACTVHVHIRVWPNSAFSTSVDTIDHDQPRCITCIVMKTWHGKCSIFSSSSTVKYLKFMLFILHGWRGIHAFCFHSPFWIQCFRCFPNFELGNFKALNRTICQSAKLYPIEFWIYGNWIARRGHNMIWF